MEKVKKRHIDKGNVLAVLVIVLCFMLTITLAGLLNGGGLLSALSWKEDGKTFYAISSGAYTDILLAKNDADVARDRGGAGFIMKKDDSFHLLLNVYKSKKNAENVLKGLSSGSYVVTIDVPKYVCSWCEGDQKKMVLTFMNFLDEAFDKLYTISNQLDTKQISKYQGIEETKTLLHQAEFYQTKFKNVMNNQTCDDRWKFESFVSTVVSYFDAMQDSARSVVSLSPSLRYTQIAILFLKIGLTK